MIPEVRDGNRESRSITRFYPERKNKEEEEKERMEGKKKGRMDEWMDKSKWQANESKIVLKKIL